MALLRIRERTSGKKLNRKPGHAAVKSAHDEWLRSMGINPNKKSSRTRKSTNSIPDYKVQSSNTVPTSDKICDNGSIKKTVRYTGTEIAGITLNHKQNYEPVRRDNKQAAVDSAQMRRN